MNEGNSLLIITYLLQNNMFQSSPKREEHQIVFEGSNIRKNKPAAQAAVQTIPDATPPEAKSTHSAKSS